MLPWPISEESRYVQSNSRWPSTLFMANFVNLRSNPAKFSANALIKLMFFTTYLKICWSKWIIIHQVGFKNNKKKQLNAIQLPTKVHPIKFGTKVHGIHGTSIAGTSFLILGLKGWKSGMYPRSQVHAFVKRNDMGVEPKIGGKLQNGWWKSWKTLLKWKIWEVFPLFLETKRYSNAKRTVRDLPSPNMIIASYKGFVWVVFFWVFSVSKKQ